MRCNRDEERKEIFLNVSIFNKFTRIHFHIRITFGTYFVPSSNYECCGAKRKSHKEDTTEKKTTRTHNILQQYSASSERKEPRQHTYDFRGFLTKMLQIIQYDSSRFCFLRNNNVYVWFIICVYLEYFMLCMSNNETNREKTEPFGVYGVCVFFLLFILLQPF